DLLDIDYFKQYNDTYGHQDGDKALISVATALKNALERPRDLVFRLGGEEFGLIFEAKTSDVAEAFAETVKDNIEALKIPHQHNSASPYVTVSMGLVFIPPVCDLSVDYYYKVADDMLYRAKDAGRNKIQMKSLVRALKVNQVEEVGVSQKS
ncbi:MAG: diguanylate cyclase, partial [Methylomarinum sp.]|nr:diguanylate cyclase [Methylomarinum sp.]